MFEGPKPLRKQLGKLRRLSRRLSRKKKGSENRQKARTKLARLHHRIRNIRQDALHKLTSYLTQNFYEIAIEDLNGDGSPDLAVSNLWTDSVSICLGNGDGTFQTAVNYGTGDGPLSVSVCDLDGDSFLDLAVANINSCTRRTVTSCCSR